MLLVTPLPPPPPPVLRLARTLPVWPQLARWQHHTAAPLSRRHTLKQSSALLPPPHCGHTVRCWPYVGTGSSMPCSHSSSCSCSSSSSLPSCQSSAPLSLTLLLLLGLLLMSLLLCLLLLLLPDDC